MTAQEQSCIIQRTWQKFPLFLQHFLAQGMLSRVKQIPIMAVLLGRLHGTTAAPFPATESAESPEATHPVPSLPERLPSPLNVPSRALPQEPLATLPHVAEAPPVHRSRPPGPAQSVLLPAPPLEQREATLPRREPVWMEAPACHIGVAQLQRPVVFVHHQPGNPAPGRLPSILPER